MINPQLAKQMINFQKAAFDDSFHAMAAFQEQTEKTFQTMLAQSNWLPEEARRAVNEWVSAYQKGRDDYKRIVDDSFEQVKALFDNAEPAQTQTDEPTQTQAEL